MADPMPESNGGRFQPAPGIRREQDRTFLPISLPDEGPAQASPTLRPIGLAEADEADREWMPWR